VENYIRKKSCENCRKIFRIEFPGVPVPSKLRMTGR
jgi:hypothetical protein